MTGYNDPISYNATLNYNGDGAVVTIDTHDGFRKKKPKQIFLPQYFSSKKEVPPIIPEQWRSEPIELQELEIEAPKELIKYDIDWDLVSSFAMQQQQNLASIVEDLDRQRIAYEIALEDEDMFNMIMMSAKHIVN